MNVTDAHTGSLMADFLFNKKSRKQAQKMTSSNNNNNNTCGPQEVLHRFLKNNFKSNNDIGKFIPFLETSLSEAYVRYLASTKSE